MVHNLRSRNCLKSGCLYLFMFFGVLASGCRERYREDLDYSYSVAQTWTIDELPNIEFVQFESVFWEPDDTVSLRKLISDDGIVAGCDVLEIGTGTGLISILCLEKSAKSVVATDINRAAAANAEYNAAMICPDQTLDVRTVTADDPSAFSVIEANEKFDLVISNPPWEDGAVNKPADHAFYDPGFQLMDSLLAGLQSHLKPNGRCLLAYGNVQAIKRLIAESEKRGFHIKILDDRKLDTLADDFLPGMLLELRPEVPMIKTGADEVAPVGKKENADADSTDSTESGTAGSDT